MFDKIKNTLKAVNTVREFHDKGLIDKLNDMLEIDNNGNNKNMSFLRGLVEIIDEATGEVVVRKHNIILLRGRTFALEKMFNKSCANSNLMYYKDGKAVEFDSSELSNKTIALFTVGNGGCVEGSPFTLNADVVHPNMSSLVNPIPFRMEPQVSGIEDTVYFDMKEVPDAVVGNVDLYKSNFNLDRVYGYYSKKVESMEWVTKLPGDESQYLDNDEVALKLGLRIEADDFKTVADVDDSGSTNDSKKLTWKRSTFINELGLQIANKKVIGSKEDYDHIELATYFNFESEPYFTPSKTSILNYYIYA